MAGQLSGILESFRKTTEPAREQMEKWQGEFNSYARKRTEQLYRTVLASPAIFVLLLVVIAAFLGEVSKGVGNGGLREEGSGGVVVVVDGSEGEGGLSEVGAYLVVVSVADVGSKRRFEEPDISRGGSQRSFKRGPQVG